MTVTEEETLRGFWSDIHASGYQLANLSPVPRELGLLDRYEIIEPDIPFSHAFPTGDIISVHRDIEKTVADIARYSVKDAATWRVLMNRFLVEKDAITEAHVFTASFVSGGSSRLRRLAYGHGRLSV